MSVIRLELKWERRSGETLKEGDEAYLVMGPLVRLGLGDQDLESLRGLVRFTRADLFWRRNGRVV